MKTIFSEVKTLNDVQRCLKSVAFYMEAKDESPIAARDLRYISGRITELNEVCLELIHAVQWCSGSGDFGPGGIAEKGWQNSVRPVIQKGYDALLEKEQEDSVI